MILNFKHILIWLIKRYYKITNKPQQRLQLRTQSRISRKAQESKSRQHKGPRSQLLVAEDHGYSHAVAEDQPMFLRAEKSTHSEHIYLKLIALKADVRSVSIPPSPSWIFFFSFYIVCHSCQHIYGECGKRRKKFMIH